MPTMRAIISDAYDEIGVYSVGEQVSAAESAYGLRKLNQLFDDWNAQRCGVYAQQFVTYTLTPSLSPHTIGPTGTFTVAQRPVTLDGANLILDNASPASYLPITLRDADWWDAQTTPTIETSTPTDVYYQPSWPNGQLFFWPVPSQAYDVELQTRVLLSSAVTLDDDFSLPPGYQTAITLTLAERLAPGLGKPPRPDLAAQAAAARARVFANNDVTPRVASADYGMQGPGGGIRADFFWPNGSVVR